MSYKKTKAERYLQEYQKEYIKEYSETLTIKQMAGAIGCSYTTVWAYCKQLRLKTTKTYFQFTPPIIPECTKDVKNMEPWKKQLLDTQNVQFCSKFCILYFRTWVQFPPVALLKKTINML